MRELATVVEVTGSAPPRQGTLRTIGGVLLLSIGAVGLVVPILPGVPLLVAGASVLGPDHPLVRPVRARLRSWWAQRHA